MEIVINWENIHQNVYIEHEIYHTLLSTFSRYKFLTKLELFLSKGTSNSRYFLKVTAYTQNQFEKLNSEGVGSDLMPALNDLKLNLKTTLKSYNPKEFEKKKLLEAKWEQDTIKNKELKAKREAEDKAIVEENKKRAKQNEEIRRKNAQIKMDIRIKKDLAKKIHKQQVIDEQTKYELQKDFLLRQKELEEKRLLKEAMLREVARIQKETIAKDLQTEELMKEDKKTLRELKEKNNEVNRINNKIVNIQSSDYDDIFPANEPFQNESNGEWYYHDGEGHIYQMNENEEWEENTIAIKLKIEDIKNDKIKELQEEKDRALVKQKRASDIWNLNAKNNSLDAKTLEKIEKNIENQDEKIKKLIAEKQQKINALEETHPANESWLGEDNKYYYHNGKGDYFTTNENNEWIKCTNPAINKIEEEFNKKRDHYLMLVDKNNNKKGSSKKKGEKNKEESKTEVKEKNPLPKPNESYQFDGKWYYFDESGNYFTTNENNEWISCPNPHIAGKKYDGKTRAIEDNYDHSEPFQDENGVWWFIDENNQYFYADANGNWIKWEENK